ncbi:MAG: hypothetical protein IPG66_12315 [Hydrogenophilales bacterium]|nr:hypothetical protein [Hydrogenophilales bacterium]
MKERFKKIAERKQTEEDVRKRQENLLKLAVKFNSRRPAACARVDRHPSPAKPLGSGIFQRIPSAMANAWKAGDHAGQRA